MIYEKNRLIPFGIARIQKTIIQLLFEGKLHFNTSDWNIAIIEQDIPCAHLAIEDFKELITSLFALKGETAKMPNINIFIEGNKRFANANLYSSNNIDRNKKYDLFIDISILQRSGLTQINNTVTMSVLNGKKILLGVSGGIAAAMQDFNGR